MVQAEKIEKTDVLQWLFDFLPHVAVSHHHPGDLKLKLKFSVLPLVGKTDLDAVAKAIPGILGIKTRWLSGSVKILYDPEKLPFDVLEDLLSLKENPDHKSQVMASLRRVINVA